MNSVDAINFINNHTALGRQSWKERKDGFWKGKERKERKERKEGWKEGRHSTFFFPPCRQKKVPK